MAQERHKTHPNYALIGFWLAVVTILEVALAEAHRDLPAFPMAGFLATIPLVPGLLAMAVIKASMVALYYMHLRFDSRLFTVFFMLPMLAGVLFILVVVFQP